MSDQGQKRIPGGVFGSAGAEVCGTFRRPYDPIPVQKRIPGGVIGSVGGKSTSFVYPSHNSVDDDLSGWPDALCCGVYLGAIIASATLAFWLPRILGL